MAQHSYVHEDIARSTISRQDISDEKRSKIEKQILSQLNRIEHGEKLLLKKINKTVDKGKVDDPRQAYFSIVHLSFNDFAQAVIGCCVFGLPAFINLSFWDYVDLMATNSIFFVHIFFSLCVMIALNYEFRNNFSFDKWFSRMLAKRFLYNYFSVMIIVVIILISLNKVNLAMTNLEVFRHFLIAQSVGLFGAVTFSFLKR
ncbi:MAG TPA: hypothetical protein ENN46_04860 [Candidatus Woesearchaeota archaeon]|nr:hypothetical protein [Candidatus Woesearchaeota archaeon]